MKTHKRSKTRQSIKYASYKTRARYLVHIVQYSGESFRRSNRGNVLGMYAHLSYLIAFSSPLSSSIDAQSLSIVQSNCKPLFVRSDRRQCRNEIANSTINQVRESQRSVCPKLGSRQISNQTELRITPQHCHVKWPLRNGRRCL